MDDIRKSQMAPVLLELRRHQSIRQSRQPPTTTPAQPFPAQRNTIAHFDDFRHQVARENWQKVRARLVDNRSNEYAGRHHAGDFTELVGTVAATSGPNQRTVAPPHKQPQSKQVAALLAEPDYPRQLVPSLPRKIPTSPSRTTFSEFNEPKQMMGSFIEGADSLGRSAYHGVGYVLHKVKSKVGLQDKPPISPRTKFTSDRGSFKNYVGQRLEIEISPEEHERFSLDHEMRVQQEAEARRTRLLMSPSCYESRLEQWNAKTLLWLQRRLGPLQSQPISAFAPQSVRMRAQIVRLDERGPYEPYLFIRLRADEEDADAPSGGVYSYSVFSPTMVTVTPCVALPAVMHRRTISVLDQRPTITTATSAATGGYYNQKQQPQLQDIEFVDEPPFGRGAALRWAAQQYFRPKMVPLSALTEENGYLRNDSVVIRLHIEPIFPLCKFWSSNDGQITCRVDRLRERRQRERIGLCECYRSDYFYSAPRGYRLQLRLYLNGVDACRGTHVSAFLDFLAGEWDDHLPPLRRFPHRTMLAILDPWSSELGTNALLQSPRKIVLHNTDGFMWDFVLDLVSKADLRSESFVRDDTLLVRVKVEPLLHGESF